MRRRLATAVVATAAVAGLVTFGTQAAGAAAGPRSVPAVTPAPKSAGNASGQDPLLCDDWGDGNCVQEHGTDVQVTIQGGTTTGYTLSDRGNVTSSGVWPFTGGTGYNSLYNGHEVVWWQDSSGDCLQAEDFSAGREVVPEPSCSDNPWAKWVLVGNWAVNVGESDENSGWYPYSAVMEAGCTGAGCKVWVGKSTPSGSATNQWGER
jgi:hypothetical protein